MTYRPKKNVPCRLVFPYLAKVAFGVATTAVSSTARAETFTAGPPVQTRSESAPSSGASVGAYLRLPVTYTLLRGSEFDGRHVGVLDANRTIYLPRISGGAGFNPSVGIKLEELARHFSLMAGVGFGFSRHQAISYNVGNSWYEHTNATFYHVEIDVRALVEFGQFKPFFAIAPGYAMLSLPEGITVLDASRNVSWSNVTLRGLSVQASLGLLYQIIAPLALDASIGYRLQQLNSSGAGAISGFGASPGWLASLGVVMFLE